MGGSGVVSRLAVWVRLVLAALVWAVSVFILLGVVSNLDLYDWPLTLVRVLSAAFLCMLGWQLWPGAMSKKARTTLWAFAVLALAGAAILFVPYAMIIIACSHNIRDCP